MRRPHPSIERNALLERCERAEAAVGEMSLVLHSALGYLSAEDDPQARRICQDAALALMRIGE